MLNNDEIIYCDSYSGCGREHAANGPCLPPYTEEELEELAEARFEALRSPVTTPLRRNR